MKEIGFHTYVKKWITKNGIRWDDLEEILNSLSQNYYEIFSIRGDITGYTIIAYRYEEFLEKNE